MSETDQTAEGFRYRIRREASGALAWLREAWSDKRWFRWLSIAVLAVLVAFFVGWTVLTRNLPDAETLLDYEPPLPSMVRGIDGEIVHSYARERRVQLQFKDLPTQLINAYTSAEDKTFWTHGGIDLGGFASAVIDYASKLGTGERAVGGSTITQQVAKNILVGNEYSVTRKLKEMVLARRIEDVLSKREIITLYLNEIPLGRRSFGVQAAARAYFDKDVGDLNLPEMAYLAILPKAPETYSRSQHFDLALQRRNFVLDQMADNGHITAAEAAQAKSAPLGIVDQRPETRSADAGYFLEEVRRELMSRYGENAEDGPDSVYAGGLWVRTSLDTDMQTAAQNSLRAGLMRYHGNRGWTGPVATIDPSKGDLKRQLASSYLSINYQDWKIGVVTQRNGNSAQIGFSDGKEAPLSNLPDRLKVGDVIAASPSGNGWRVRTVPEVSGGFLAQDPNTGRILAMQGGFDPRLDSFNRATQANRQPGSTIKPFVYATGLDSGMTPATMVPDKTYCYYQGANLGEKCFRNFSGQGGGEHTMRWGLEQSRNLMTVHIAMDSGMENVVKTFDRAGIGKYDPFPAFALGAGETTVEKMVAAYSGLFNHGLKHEPTVIDYVQDRNGKVIWRADDRDCSGCNMDEWDGRPMPRLPERGNQILDPRTAYQVVHMMEGVVQRGTAVALRDLGMPLAGKTGTTSGPTNVWFIGGSPDIVAGVYMGFDRPRNMGGYAQGGTLAAPIFKQFVRETRSKWSERPFLAPEGVRMVRIDRRTGRRVFDAWPSGEPLAGVIWEAFKPDTEPTRKGRRDEIDEMRELVLAQLRRREAAAAAAANAEREPADFVEEQGGLY
ncbi:penicillin-binding protein 1A [Altererythrobacter atlanticus]|uniref:peptidoglycan glycosyltransferase n=1 Tax=Croceibacterium atlanticum TaxID=1267766 RepID=A0A0F7KQ73_9SPHN|nr:transglycosylase domain-containing protein [Croceibacterium atlanticum]AKH41699.1 Penicillin-binding protein 1A [Croceibacterium atlanticum]MBB5733163.1 penicillin-binding protein 1A [Croceibacterium atlanticum]